MQAKSSFVSAIAIAAAIVSAPVMAANETARVEAPATAQFAPISANTLLSAKPIAYASEPATLAVAPGQTAFWSGVCGFIVWAGTLGTGTAFAYHACYS